jgi:hypothetical protein
MTSKIVISAIAASFALAGAPLAMAQIVSGQTAGTLGVGGATASPHGAHAGGMVAGQAQAMERRDDRRDDRRDRRGESTTTAPSSTSTYGSGAINTTRDGASVGVTSGAAASGSGALTSGTTVDAYGETTRDGSSADMYGSSGATATPTPAPR